MRKAKFFACMIFGFCVGSNVPVYGYVAKELSKSNVKQEETASEQPEEWNLPRETGRDKGIEKEKDPPDIGKMEQCEGELPSELQVVHFYGREKIPFNFRNPDITEFIEYLKQISPDFDMEDYLFQYLPTGYNGGSLRFDFVIGEFETDAAYTFHITDGKTESLYILNYPGKGQINVTEETPSESELKQMAVLFDDLPTNRYQVKNQTVRKFYETGSGNAYFIIVTDYSTGDGWGDYGVVTVCKYPIGSW